MKRHKVQIIAAVLVITLFSLMTVVGAFVLSGMINAASESDIDLLKKYVFFSLAYVCGILIIGRLSNYLRNNLIRQINLSVRREVFDGIIHRSKTEFTKKSVGEYMTMIASNVDAVSGAYLSCIFDITAAIVTVLAAVLSMAVINLELLLMVFVIGILYMLLTGFLGRNLEVYKDKWKEVLSSFTVQLKELLSGYSVIRDFNLQQPAINMFDNSDKQLEDQSYRLRMKFENIGNTNYVLAQIIVISIVLASSYMVSINRMNVGELIALAQLVLSVISPIQDMMQSINEVKSSRNIEGELSLAGEKGITEPAEADMPEFDENNISIRNVSFSYDGEHNVLDDVSLDVEQGKKYAIIGESGSGKSSLVDLCMKNNENYEGSITLNGIDYKKLDANWLSKLFAVVQQNVFLFDGTIKQNITLFQERKDAEIKEAIDKACINTLVDKKGLAEYITENGSELSGGERQRISIARALMMKRKILVLDEATSALDEPTAKKVLSNILDIKGQTCIAILHNLPSELMGRFDKIFRVQNGKIQEMSGLRFEAVEAAKQFGSAGVAIMMFIMAIIAAIIRLML
ncbi:MAG: ABC transporter ATP-binding protein/permease [Butyrivibrio sp.]|nr:ABC transporter ATP-binding protein/permease [Butyrivibrio sp.]